jgi:YaiO family outer membrane protein
MKLTSLALAALAALTFAAGAHAAKAGDGRAAHSVIQGGQVEYNVSRAGLSGPYADQRIQWGTILLDLKGGHKLGLSATHVEAWGDHARYLNVRLVTPLRKDLWLDTNLGGSDRAAITAERRINTTLNKGWAQEGLIAGVGVDYYEMRSGGSAAGLKTHVVYYVPGMPLVLQGDLTATRTSVNERLGARVGVAATYGRVGEWTAALRLDTGRVHYELVHAPGAVADYRNHNAALNLRWWVERNWGLSAALSHTTNRYFERNEARLGVFHSF